MAYGAATATNQPAVYDVVVVVDGIRVPIKVSGMTVPFLPEETDAQREARRDAVFQTFVTLLAGISGATIESAKKTGEYFVPCTP